MIFLFSLFLLFGILQIFKRYYFIGCTYCDFLVVLYYIYWLWIKDERRKCILNDKQATQRCHRGCQARWKLYSLSYSAPNAYPQANQGYSPPPQFGTIPVIQLLTPWTRMPIRLLNSIHVNDVKLSSTTTTLLPTKCLWRSTCPSSGECSSDNNNKRRWNGRRRSRWWGIKPRPLVTTRAVVDWVGQADIQ